MWVPRFHLSLTREMEPRIAFREGYCHGHPMTFLQRMMIIDEWSRVEIGSLVEVLSRDPVEDHVVLLGSG